MFLPINSQNRDQRQKYLEEFHLELSRIVQNCIQFQTILGNSRQFQIKLKECKQRLAKTCYTETSDPFPINPPLSLQQSGLIVRNLRIICFCQSTHRIEIKGRSRSIWRSFIQNCLELPRIAYNSRQFQTIIGNSRQFQTILDETQRVQSK